LVIYSGHGTASYEDREGTCVTTPPQCRLYQLHLPNAKSSSSQQVVLLNILTFKPR